jgi:hypothetical protein
MPSRPPRWQTSSVVRCGYRWKPNTSQDTYLLYRAAAAQMGEPALALKVAGPGQSVACSASGALATSQRPFAALLPFAGPWQTGSVCLAQPPAAWQTGASSAKCPLLLLCCGQLDHGSPPGPPVSQVSGRRANPPGQLGQGPTICRYSALCVCNCNFPEPRLRTVCRPVC